MKRLSISKGRHEIASGVLAQPLIAVGRSPTCDVVLRAPGVAAVHFLIDWIGESEFDPAYGEWIVSDASRTIASDAQARDGAGDGVLLGPRPVEFAGFVFRLVEDTLHETHFEAGLLHATLERESAAEPPFGGRETPTALEVVRVQADTQAVIDVLHAPRRKAGKTRFRGGTGLFIEWRGGEARVGWPNNTGAIAFNRGREETGSVERDSHMRRVTLHAGDFLKVRFAAEEVYLRYVAPVATEPIPQSIWHDPLARMGLIGLAIAFVFLGVARWAAPPPDAAPMEEPRLARIEVREPAKPLPPTVATPAPKALPKPVVARMTPPPVVARLTPPPAPAKPPPIQARRPPPPAKTVAKVQPINRPAARPNVAGPSAKTIAKSAPGSGSAGKLGSSKGPPKEKPGEPNPQASAMAMLAALKGGSDVRVNSAALKEAASSERAGSKTGDPDFKPQARVTLEDGGGPGGPVDLAQAGRGVSTAGAAHGSSLKGDLGSGEGAGKFALGSGNGAGGGFRMEFDGSGASVSGGLSREVVRKAVARRRASFQNCVASSGLAKANRPRQIAFEITISGQGQAQSARLKSSEMNSPAFESCMAAALKATPFPPAENGHETVVYYPFLFKI